VLLASKPQLKLVQAKLKLATGGWTVGLTCWLLLLLPPASLTVSVTVKFPGPPYAWVAVLPDPLALPSPQTHV
jgi:hypothetical protein